MKRPAISASAAEDMTCFIIPETVRTAPLLRMGLMEVVWAPRKKWPLARLRPLGTERYVNLEEKSNRSEKRRSRSSAKKK